MGSLVEIAFKGNRKEFFLWEGNELPPLKAGVIVDADRGEDLGHVHSVGEAAESRNAKVPHGTGGATPTQKARRLASSSDLKQYSTVRTDDDDARKKTIERVRANGLVMKVTDAEWQWDRKKLTLYFTAEKRVDFRTLVRELAAMFRTRIELKQIGVRDEAKRLDGYGRCGRQYCSSSWLPELRKPGRRAILPAAASVAVETLGFVADADLLQFNACPEHRRQLPHQGAKIDAFLGREIQ